MWIDSHNHTSHFSGDARMTAEELIGAAVNAKLGGVVITEHYEADFPDETERIMVFSVDSFFPAFSSWKSTTPGDFLLLAGIELGYQPHLAAAFDAMIPQYPFDSVILSNHLFGGHDPYFNRACYEKSKSELYSAYIHELADMVDACDEFDIVGHYDYIARYAQYPDMKMRYVDAPIAFDRFLLALITKGKSLEINTSSVEKLRVRGIEDPLPDRRILTRYRELGGARVTLGSDSHDVSTLGIHFDKTAEYIKSLGFEYLTYFVDREARQIPL